MAGIGISKMSVASKTTVGGYAEPQHGDKGQFQTNDTRSVPEFCAALQARGLEPVFKNWDAAFRCMPGTTR
jgi:2-iminoacetate synthase